MVWNEARESRNMIVKQGLTALMEGAGWDAPHPSIHKIQIFYWWHFCRAIGRFL